MAGYRDVGLQAVEEIFRTLQIDPVWSVRRPRGFTWWSYRLAQHIDASEPWQDDEFQLAKVRIITELVNSVDPNHRTAELVAIANAQESLSALILDAEHRNIVECCTGIVHQENVGWLAKLLATAAIMQNSAAHARVQPLAEAVGGLLAATSHPDSGPREQPDDMLGVPQDVIVPAGKDKSSFSGALCAELKDFLPQYQLLGFSDAESFSCEVPFTGATPVAAKVGLGVADTSARPETSLLRIFPDVPHPQYGHGALVTLLVPITFDVEQVPLVVNQLNFAEATGNIPTNLLGAWCPEPTNPGRNTVAFNCFLPSLLGQPGVLENQIVFQAARSRFVGQSGELLFQTAQQSD